MQCGPQGLATGRANLRTRRERHEMGIGAGRLPPRPGQCQTRHQHDHEGGQHYGSDHLARALQ